MAGCNSTTSHFHYQILTLGAYPEFTTPQTNARSNINVAVAFTQVAVRLLIHPVGHQVNGENLSAMRMAGKLEIDARSFSPV